MEEGIKPLSPCDDNPSLLAEAESLFAPLAPQEGTSSSVTHSELFSMFLFCFIIKLFLLFSSEGFIGSLILQMVS